MNVQKQIQSENNWKEIAKKVIDNCNNYNDYQKEVIKLFIEDFYHHRKNAIIKTANQAALLEAIINNDVK